ncbi:uncharacterized protein LOC119069262 [Bradysia coprophila]|uniref:uncharacterized protein LOC119069262 n=1 Tax=Bradysia coprophila TaxID=38358 RepID=UPI00187DB69C|nr:uncharacterized protein LOC119069262 [Bradysia coprophila]
MMKCKKSYFVFCLVFLISDSRCSDPNSDKYITASKAECFSSKNLFSCIKYKTARFIWSVAAGKIQLIKNPLNSEHFNLVRITNDGEEKEFSEYRYEQDVPESTKALSFLKRSVHMFLATHGFQISFGKDTGARLISDPESDDVADEYRGKKKRKLQLVLPLLILLKMVKIKVLLLTVLLGIGSIQLLLVAGGILLFHYFKHTTHCKVQGLPIHSHSHIIESEPEPYSTYTGYHYSQPSYHSSGSYAKDWASSRAYSAFNNYMDTPHSSS